MTCCKIKAITDLSMVYVVSFGFSGCAMALFEYEGAYYAAHITTSEDGIDGKEAWNTFLEDPKVGKSILFCPHLISHETPEGFNINIASVPRDYTGLIEFTSIDEAACFSIVNCYKGSIAKFCAWSVTPKKEKECKFPGGKKFEANFNSSLLEEPQGLGEVEKSLKTGRCPC